MANTELQPAAEFQALPLEFIVAAPLTAAIKAQAVAAQATIEFVEKFKGDTIQFEFESEQEGTVKKNKVNAPLLSMVPVPHLRIDSLTINFKYEISQTVKESSSMEKGLSLDVSSGALLSPWVSATLKGSVSSRSSEESTMNRSGTLEITVHASEAPMPEGLSKILGLLANSVPSVKSE